MTKRLWNLSDFFWCYFCTIFKEILGKETFLDIFFPHYRLCHIFPLGRKMRVSLQSGFPNVVLSLMPLILALPHHFQISILCRFQSGHLFWLSRLVQLYLTIHSFLVLRMLWSTNSTYKSWNISFSVVHASLRLDAASLGNNLVKFSYPQLPFLVFLFLQIQHSFFCKDATYKTISNKI